MRCLHARTQARLKIVSLPEVYFPLVRGEQGGIGGELRLRPSRKQVVLIAS